MLKVKVENSGDAQRFLVELEEKLDNPKRLHSAMGVRLQDELTDHFYLRNQQPNKRGWRKLDWWAGVAEATSLTRADDKGAEVTVAHDQGFAMRARGGVIKPVEAKALTIPNVEEAYGKSVAEYEAATGRRLFTPVGARYMAYSDDNENVVLVYFLASQARIKKDDDALPSEDKLKVAMHEEITDYLDFN